MSLRHRTLESRHRRPAGTAFVLTVLLILGVAVVPARASAFPDVPTDHPYVGAIDEMADRGVVNGYENGNFGPDDRVFRQQFAKMIVLGLELPVSEADICYFTDVPRDLSPLDPFFPDNYVAVCAQNGITIGVSGYLFAPYANITRAQLITMVARAASLPFAPESYSPPFADFDPSHYPYARDAAWAGLLDGLVDMGPGYDFWRPATRGEVCQLLHNLLAWQASELIGLWEAIDESGQVEGDFFVTDSVIYGAWAGAIIGGPEVDPARVLLYRGSGGWEVVALGTDLTMEEWIDLGAPEDIAVFLSPDSPSVLDELVQAIEASEFVAEDFEVVDYLVEDDFAGVICRSPGVEDLPVLLYWDHYEWLVVDVGTDRSQEDWMAYGASREMAEFLSPWSELEVIRDVIAQSGSVAEDFEIVDSLISGDWAGVKISSPGLENCAVLLFDSGLVGWAVVDLGTDLSQEDILGHGAPLEVAEFLSPGS